MNFRTATVSGIHFLRSFLLLFFITLCGCVAGDEAKDIEHVDSAQETKGVGRNSIWIEAESASSVVVPWVVEAKIDGHSGSGYLFNTSDIALARAGGEMVYEFEIEEPGEYLAIIRGRRDNQGSCLEEEYDKCNDVRTAWNGGPFEKNLLKGPWGCWIWETRIETARESEHKFTRNTAMLDRGKNTFHLGVRSDGVKVDLILIHRVGDPLPTGPYIESACSELLGLDDAVERHGRPLPTLAE